MADGCIYAESPEEKIRLKQSALPTISFLGASEEQLQFTALDFEDKMRLVKRIPFHSCE